MTARLMAMAKRRDGTLLSQATSWWTPAVTSAGDMLDQGQAGVNHLTDTGSVVYGNDGTHHYAALRAADLDYLAAAGTDSLSPGSGDFSFVGVVIPRVNLTGGKILFSDRDGTGKGWNVFTDGTGLRGNTDVAADSSGAVAVGHPTALAVGTRRTLAVVRSSGSHHLVIDGTPGPSLSNPGNIDNANEFRINRGSGATTAYSDIDLYGAAWFKGVALTDEETAQIGTELLLAGEL